MSCFTRGSPQRDQLKSAPEWVVGLGIPASFLLLCPLPSWLSFQQWGSTAHPHCHPSAHKSAVTVLHLQSGWKLELQVDRGPAHPGFPSRTCPSSSVLSRPYCVLSWRDCGSLLPLLSPWALPRAEVRSVSGLLLVQLSPFAVFWRIRAGADVHMCGREVSSMGLLAEHHLAFLPDSRDLGP